MRSATTLGLAARLVMLAAAGTLSAADPSEPVYIPAAAHAPGVGGTVWRTDLYLSAWWDTSAVLGIDLLPRGTDNSDPVSEAFTLAASTSETIADVLGQTFGFEGIGALRVTVREGALEITSRTYNDDPDGTYGQFIPAMPDSDAFASPDQALLIGLSRSESTDRGFRTNIGFLNVTSDTIALEVDLASADGSLLGTVSVQLGPFSHEQITDIFAEVTDGDVADGSARVRATTDGARFLAYASVVDNRSGDPIFVPAQSTLQTTASQLQGSWTGRMIVDLAGSEDDFITAVSITFDGSQFLVETPQYFYQGTFNVIPGPEDPGWLSFVVTNTDDPDNLGDWDGVYALDGNTFVFGWFFSRPADFASAPWVILVSRTTG